MDLPRKTKHEMATFIVFRIRKQKYSRTKKKKKKNANFKTNRNMHEKKLPETVSPVKENMKSYE